MISDSFAGITISLCALFPDLFGLFFWFCCVLFLFWGQENKSGASAHAKALHQVRLVGTCGMVLSTQLLLGITASHSTRPRLSVWKTNDACQPPGHHCCCCCYYCYTHMRAHMHTHTHTHTHWASLHPTAPGWNTNDACQPPGRYFCCCCY